jgi:hypothetical protein
MLRYHLGRVIAKRQMCRGTLPRIVPQPRTKNAIREDSADVVRLLTEERSKREPRLIYRDHLSRTFPNPSLMDSPSIILHPPPSEKKHPAPPARLSPPSPSPSLSPSPSPSLSSIFLRMRPSISPTRLSPREPRTAACGLRLSSESLGQQVCEHDVVWCRIHPLPQSLRTTVS